MNGFEDIFSRTNIYRIAPGEDLSVVRRLREEVYVHEFGRINSVDDFSESFDRYNKYATYFVANLENEAVGSIKVISDSPSGLPCEQVKDIQDFRRGKTLVEFGHLIVLSKYRSTKIVFLLMKECLMFSISQLNATHILADIFVDEKGEIQNFYLRLGFSKLGEPYHDSRFISSPKSALIYLSIFDAIEKHNNNNKINSFFDLFMSGVPELKTL